MNRVVAAVPGIELKGVVEHHLPALGMEKRALECVRTDPLGRNNVRSGSPGRVIAHAGECRQARAVGGDYYNFLDLGDNRFGFVLADVAGKGMSAALLMSNLQANLRSQSALAARDLPQLLQSVNRLDGHTTTRFF
jgi:Stage II sporulation protein E (SpoIIE)